MTADRKRPSLAFLLYSVVIVTLGGYFAFASVQGDHGLFQRMQFEAELTDLQMTSAKLDEELAYMRNNTLLLDQQARDVLGYMRADEIVIR